MSHRGSCRPRAWGGRNCPTRRPSAAQGPASGGCQPATRLTPPRPAIHERRGGLVLILGALTALGPLSIDMYLPALPALTDDLGTHPSATQLTITACLIGLALGQVIAGPLSDSAGRRQPLLIGAVLYAITSMMCAIAPSVSALVALRLVQGIASGACIVITRAIVRDLYEGSAAARFFAVLMQISGVAPIVAPLIGGQVLRATSWRGVFVLLAAVSVVLILGGQADYQRVDSLLSA